MNKSERIVRAVESAAAADGFLLDAAQRSALDRLSALGADVTGGASRRGAARSLYVYGEPGRGKSWLADAFYTALPTKRKTRVHFHGFFDELHRKVYSRMGEKDAIEQAIDEVVGHSRLLFFDELHVHDSGDARLLNRLLERVFAQRIVVLATSNYAPDRLLPDPQWHHIFEPGIALIQAHMEVWELAGATDYRATNRGRRQGFAAGVWTTNTPTPARSVAQSIEVRGRTFTVASAENGELRATFAQLCQAPTSTVEYLQWAREYGRWTVAGIPRFAEADPEAQQRFINLIDVLVEANVTVDFFANVGLEEFLADASQRPDAFRMASRLQLLSTEAVPPIMGRETK